MPGLNKVMIIGNVGKDPEVRYSQSGSAVCTFSVATSESWTKDGQKQEKTEWHNVVAFNKQAETLEKYLKKGDKVYLEGKLQTSQYEKDGQTHYATKIIVFGFQFLGKKTEEPKQRQGTNQEPEQNQEPISDIPF